MRPIVSPNVRIRHPDLFIVGNYSIVDDFCYFSTQVRIGTASHIASGCSVAGGRALHFSMGDFCSLSSGVKIWCTSDDFKNDLVTILPPGAPPLKRNLLQGSVECANFTAIGANSVVMPDNTIPEGTVIGALSFVPFQAVLEPWSVYAGTPVRKVGERNRRQVLDQAGELYRFLAASRLEGVA